MSVRRVAATILAVAALGGCAARRAALPADGPRASDGRAFAADVVATQDGRTSRARVVATARRLRLEMEGQRRSSVAIARWDAGDVLVLAPTLGVYRTLPLAAWQDPYPNPLRPDLRIEREGAGERAVVDGIPARRWRVRVPAQHGARAFAGVLWEAEALPGRPLRWEDAESGLVVEWRNARELEPERGTFEVPAGYRPAPGGAGAGTGAGTGATPGGDAPRLVSAR